MAENYTVVPGVLLSNTVKHCVKRVADRYYASTKKKIVVTSGTHGARGQAAALYNKLAAGDSLAMYKNQLAIKGVKSAYDNCIREKKSKTETVNYMEKVIKLQVNNSIFISEYLRDGVVDIRCRNMTYTEKEKFKQAAQGNAKSLILKATPPHFHLQF